MAHEYDIEDPRRLRKEPIVGGVYYTMIENHDWATGAVKPYEGDGSFQYMGDGIWVDMVTKKQLTFLPRYVFLKFTGSILTDEELSWLYIVGRPHSEDSVHAYIGEPVVDAVYRVYTYNSTISDSFLAYGVSSHGEFQYKGEGKWLNAHTDEEVEGLPKHDYIKEAWFFLDNPDFKQTKFSIGGAYRFPMEEPVVDRVYNVYARRFGFLFWRRANISKGEFKYKGEGRWVDMATDKVVGILPRHDFID